MIDDLIREGAARTPLSEQQVRQALAAALGLMQKHAAAGPLRELFAAVPGAESLAGEGQALQPKGGGLLGGLMKGVGGAGGAATADAMATMSRLNKDGVHSGALKELLPVVQQALQQRTGRDLLGPVLQSVPGVGALLK